MNSATTRSVRPLRLLFWGSIATLIWVYLLYPLVARAAGACRPVSVRTDPRAVRRVTVGLAVHNGGGAIEARIANILTQVVPFELEVVVASDGSSDATAALVQRASERDARIRVLELPRMGQSAAQSAMFEAARGEIVVLTDVETRFAPGCLAALVGPFADDRVGCVTGVLSFAFDASTDTARHEGAYWRYEQAVRSFESRAGWLAAGTGALLAVRRSIYRPAPSHASLDQMLPLYTRMTGQFVLVAPDARGTDRGADSVSGQVASRTRIATQGIEANLRMSRHMPPWREPGPFLALWSHKVLRWGTPYLGLLAASAGIALWRRTERPVYLVPAAGMASMASLAAAELAAQRTQRRVPIGALALTVTAVNVSFARAWINVLLRRRVSTWSTPNGVAEVVNSTHTG